MDYLNFFDFHKNLSNVKERKLNNLNVKLFIWDRPLALTISNIKLSQYINNKTR